MSANAASRQAALPTTPNSAVMQAIRSHHVELAEQLAARTAAVRNAAEGGSAGPQVLALRDQLCDWYRTVLAPHVRAEEKTLYAEAFVIAEAQLLVRSMIEEHGALNNLVHELEQACDPVRAASLAAALQSVFDLHLAEENDLLIPTLDRASVPLATVLEGMHEVLGDEAADQVVSSEAAHDGECGCGHDNAIDVRALPHGERHEIIFGRLDELTPGTTLMIVNDHDPKPLRYQTEALWPGRFTWTYLESGPERWRVEIMRAS